MLYSGTEGMERTEGLEYEAGDFTTFEATIPHGWKNGSAASRIEAAELFI